MHKTLRDAGRRLVAGGAASALAVAGLSLGLAAPAHAAPVNVTGTLTDAAGNALDGWVSASALGADGFYESAGSAYVADGVVSIAVEPGTYKFSFGDEDRLFADEYYNDKPTFDAADPVVVTGGLALAPVVLAPKPAITGVVLDASGQPAPNARVEAYDAANGYYENSVDARADGTFAIGVDAGTYKIRAMADGLAVEYYNNKPTLETADAVPAGAALDPIILSEGSVVAGRVANPSDGALERVRVTLYSATGQNYIDSDLTDAAGLYRIEGVRPGAYKVQFSDPIGEYITEWHSDKADYAAADVVNVAIDATLDVSAVLTPDPTAVIDPAKVDISGTVVDSSGAPVLGARVAAYDTPADADAEAVFDSVRSNRAGQFFFDLPTSETTFKLEATDDLEREEGQYQRLSRFFGGAQTYKAAKEVAKGATGVAISLPLTGGVSGSVSSESDLRIRGVSVNLIDAEDGGNAGGASAKADGTYLTTSVLPGTYKVRFSGGGSYVDNVLRTHAPEWYNNTVFGKARTITVKSGQTTTGINAALSEDLRAMRKPEINGQPYLGKTVKAYPGVWSVRTGTTYAYEWTLDGKVVGEGAKYRIPKSAKNGRVTLRVIAENGTLSGEALVSSQKLRLKPKVKIKVKGTMAAIVIKAKKVKGKKIKGNVVVKRIVRKDYFGAPIYKKVGKAKIRKGKAATNLKKLKKGKNKLVFFIKLKGKKVGDAQISKTVKLKKKRR